MKRVVIALGSACRQSVHIQWATSFLMSLLSDVSQSHAIWTRDIKGGSRWYMNRLVAGNTDMSYDELQDVLKDAEKRTDRSKENITIDLDILQYDGERHHLSDWNRPYVQQLIDYVI